MKKTVAVGGLLVLGTVAVSIVFCQQESQKPEGTAMKLPAPRLESPVSLEKALHDRRSLREFSQDPLMLDQVSQLLWSAQGITHPDGFRAAPSAGALYPLEVYLVAGNVRNLSAGLYHYRPATHDLERSAGGDFREALSQSALGQESVRGAAAVLVLTAVYERTTGKYGERGERYVNFEIGHAAQNILLQAVALGLGGVPVGSFDDASVQQLLSLPHEEHPRYLIPIGNR
jgi:SagB-type dehydrogenase family enzyme